VKLISFILSIYILALGVIPCADAASHPYQDTQISISQPHTDHQQQDGCTPLCICNCCQISIDQPQNNFYIPTPVLQREYGAKLLVNPIERPFSIWQPPKV